MFAYIFNLYDMMLLTITTLSVLLTLPLLLKREKQKRDLYLGAFLLTQGFVALITVLSFNEQTSAPFKAVIYPFEHVPLIFSYGLEGIFLYWYTQSMMNKQTQFEDKLNKIVVSVIVTIFTLETATSLFNEQFTKFPTFCWLLRFLSAYLGFVCILKLNRFDYQIKQHLSNIDQANLNWLRYVVFGFAATWCLQISSNVVALIGFKEFAVSISTFANVPPLFLLSSMVIYSQTTFLNIKNLDEKTLEESSPTPLKSNKEVTDKIHDLMERVKIYQDPELRLEGLADSLGLSPRSVSSVLNGHFQKTFYDFVNEYRIKDAAGQLKDPNNANKTIQRIFEDAGFNSKTTFNTLFKKNVGTTPSEFRKTAELA